MIQGLSSTWHGKPPKSPRPDRSNMVFLAIEKGLRECIGITLTDICMLKSSIEDGVSISSSQQYKTAERYLKRLEYQLSKLEELKEQYDVHLKMRDGVRTMAYAYVLSPGKEKNSALNSVRSGFKECTETLCSIESELENMMGTLLLQMKGIQGFARLCPGDVFEITIKHGDQQKWKSKGRILKDGNQVWDNQQLLLKALLGDILSIKAVEVRGLGKNVTLGHKLCETKDLFSAHPQLMTINLNAIGTLKLNLVVTWNPLHCLSNEFTSSNLRQFNSTSSTSLLGIGSSRTLPSSMMSLSNLSIGKKFVGTLPCSKIIDDAHFYNPAIHERSLKSESKATTSTSTSTSSGSTGSLLHLTGSSGFGSASSSSYCDSSSVPNSALTSPDTENAPRLQESNKALSATNINICPKHGIKKSSTMDENLSRKVIAEVIVHQESNSIYHQDNRISHQSNRIQNLNDEILIEDENENDIEMNDYRYSSISYERENRICSKLGQYNTESTAYLYFNIGDTLINLMTSLEDIQGQYAELQVLQQHVIDLYRVLKQINKIRMFLYEKENVKKHSRNTNIIANNSNSYNKISRNNNVSNTNSMNRVRRNSVNSEISISIESALECFDFLNSVITDSEQDSSPEHEKYKRKSKSVQSINNYQERKVNTRGYKNNHQRNSEYFLSDNCLDNNSFNNNTKNMCINGQNGNNRSTSAHNLSLTGTPSPVNSPLPFTTGSEQLDVTLMSHLTYSQRLLENLGSFGPLHKRELQSLRKLQTQALALKSLERMCTNLFEYLQEKCEFNDEQKGKDKFYLDYNQKQEQVISFLRKDSRIGKLWEFITNNNNIGNDNGNLDSNGNKSNDDIGEVIIYVTSGHFADSLEKFICYQSNLNINNGNTINKKISKLMTSRLIDSTRFEDDCIVSIFQLGIYFSQETLSLEQLFKLYLEEIILIDSIQSGDVIEIKQCLNKFKKCLPPKEPLFSISLLLLDNDPLIVRISETFFLESRKNKNIRQSMITQFLEGLESDYETIRQASCVVLMLMNATESMDSLVYISCADTSDRVREQAKATLFSFGDIGRKLFEESQLFSNGFQGLSVK